MSKRIIFYLIILLNLISSEVLAQDSILTSRTRFGFFSGLIFPSGALASKDLSNPNAGFAKSGTYFPSVFAEWMIKKNQWVGVQLSMTRSPFDANSFQQKIQLANPGNTITTQTGDAWRTISLMVGGTNDYAISKSKYPLYFVLRSYVGVSTISSPSLFIQQMNNATGAFRSTKQQSASSTTPIVSIDIGLRTIRKARNGVASAFLLVGFVYAAPKFNNVPFILDNNGAITNSTISFRQPMSQFSVTAGFDLNFYKGFFRKRI